MSAAALAIAQMMMMSASQMACASIAVNACPLARVYVIVIVIESIYIDYENNKQKGEYFD